MRFTMIMLLGLLISCKGQQSSTTKTAPNASLPSVSTYEPNPDEAVIQAKLIESEKTSYSWRHKVEVIRQLRSGFGVKSRLKPGEIVLLTSKEDISSSEFYAAVEVQAGIDNESYSIKTLLKD